MGADEQLDELIKLLKEDKISPHDFQTRLEELASKSTKAKKSDAEESVMAERISAAAEKARRLL